MKRFLLALLITLFVAGQAFPLSWSNGGGGGGGLVAYEVLTLPGSPADGDGAVITNGADTSDCTVGGGTWVNLCLYDADAATWVIAGDGTSPGVGSGSVTTLQESGSQVGDADIVTINFDTGFTLAEAPDTLVKVSFDLAPGSGSATLIATDDALQVKYDTTDFGEGASGLELGAAPTIAGDLALGAAPASTGAAVGDLLMSNATGIYFEAAPAGTDVAAIVVDSAELITIGGSGSSGVTITPATTVTGVLTTGSTVELGHADDTTIARDSSGVISVEGAVVSLLGATIGASEVDADVATQSELETVAALVDTDDKIIAIINASPSTQISVVAGGTNSGTALNNDFVMVSSGGAIIESATVTATELGLLNGETDLASQSELDTVAALVDTDDEIIAIINASPSTQIVHEAGGLEADVNAYTGLLAISGGSTSEVDDKSELETQIADVADFAEADGDVYTGTHDFGDADDLEIPNGASPTTDTTGQIALNTDGTDADFTGPVLQISTNGATIGYIPTMTDMPEAAEDDYIMKYNAATNLMVWEVDVAGNAPVLNAVLGPETAWSIAFDDDEKITWSTAQNTAGNFLTIDNTVADVTGQVYLLNLDYSVDDNQALADYIIAQDAGGAVFALGQNGDIVTTGGIDITGATELTLANDETITNATDGTVSFSGGIAIPDTGNIGSASDLDSIAIAADGKVTFSQDVIVSGTGIELNHATENTLTASGGVLSIEGNVVHHTGGTDITDADIADDITITSTGTVEGATITEGGNAVYNATETPGGELGNTWASPTIDDSLAVTSWTLTTPTLSGIVTFSGEATPTTDADYEMSFDIDGWGTGYDALELWNGTASAYVVAATASDSPENGQVPKWNTSGEITWEDDSTGSALGSNLTSSTNDIVTDNTILQFEGNSENLTVTFGTNDVAITSDSEVAAVDFGTINLETDALDLSGGSITNVTAIGDADDAVVVGAGGTVVINAAAWDVSTTGTATGIEINADNNTITNIGDAEMESGVDAAKIGNGNVDNTELSYLNGLSANLTTSLSTGTITLTGALALNGDSITSDGVLVINATSATSFNDENITNVGQIDVDTIDADGATITIGTGSDQTVSVDSSAWTISTTGVAAGFGTIGSGAITSTGAVQGTSLVASAGDVSATDTTPALTLTDSDDAAGTGSLTFASANTQDVIGSIYVDVAGAATEYVQIDGVAETVDFLKPVTGTDATFTGTTTVTTFEMNATAQPTWTFEDSGGGDSDQESAKIVSNMTDGTATAEVSDLWFTNMQAGTPTTVILLDGSANSIEAENIINAEAGITTSNGTTTAGFVDFYEDEDEAGSNYVRLIAPILASTYTLTLPIDAGTDGYILKTDGNGVTSWTSSGAATAWDDLTAPDSDETLNMSTYTTEWTFSGATPTNDQMFTFFATGAFGDDSVVRIEQKTGDPTDGELLALVTADAEAHVDNLVMANGTDDYVTHRIVDAGTYTIDVTSDGTAAVEIVDGLTVGSLTTTGTIAGAIGVTETTDGTETVSGSGAYGHLFEADNATAADDTTYTLPAAEIGMSACFYDNGEGTGGIVLDPNSADNFILDGVAMANDENLNSPGVAGDGENGDFICIMAIDATTWVTLGRSGTWVEATP